MHVKERLHCVEFITPYNLAKETKFRLHSVSLHRSLLQEIHPLEIQLLENARGPQDVG